MFPGRVGDPATVSAGLPSLLQEMELGGINTPLRKAAFLATLAHESGLLFNAREHGDTRVYGGRGFIQLTGSTNYHDAGVYLGADLLVNPDLAMDLKWSAKCARWYWTKARDCNAFADKGQMGKVNGAIGYPVGDGKEDARRCASFRKALLYLGGSVPAGISCAR